MKKSEKFLLKDVAGSSVLIPFGEGALSFNGIITLNETAKFLWEKIDSSFEEEDLIAFLCDEYKIEADVARNSANKFISALKEVGAIEE